LWLKGLGQEWVSGTKTRLGALAVPLLPQGSVQKVGDESHDGLLHQRITIMGREWNVHNIITGVTKEMKAALPRNLKKHYQNKQSH